MAIQEVGYDDPVEAFIKRMYWTIYGPLPSQTGKKGRGNSGLWRVMKDRGRLPIVASLGAVHQEKPAEILKLLEAGANILRINFSHFRREWNRKKRFEVVRNLVVNARASRRKGLGPEFLGDLQGPKIRIHNIGQTGGDAKARLEDGKEFRIEVVDTDEIARQRPGDDRRVCTTYTRLLDDIVNSGAQPVKGVLMSPVGEPLRLLLGDGDVELQVLRIDTDKKTLVTRVTHGGQLESKKGMTIPGVHFTEKALTEEDLLHLVICLMARVESIALSFVSSGRDISAARYVINKYALLREDLEKGMENDLAPLGEFREPRLIAKIETREAIVNLSSILDVADGVMVARGDLALYTSWAELPEFERKILRAASARKRVTIAATEMLASMEEKTFPARSEVFGILFAIRNLAGACMLSGETSGSDAKNPAKAVDAMKQLIEEAQRTVPMANQQSTRAKACSRTKSKALALLTPAASRRRKTAIVASLVPSHELIKGTRRGWFEKLHEAGVDVFRLNLSIGSQGDHDAILERLNQSRRHGARVFVDFEGPKMFIGPVGVDFEHLPEATLNVNEQFEITGDEILGDATAVHCKKASEIATYYQSLGKRDRRPPILLGDRHVVLEVKETHGSLIRTRVAQGGVILPGMGVTIPGFPFSSAWLNELKDRLKHIRDFIDLVGLSFAEGKGAVKTLRKLVGPRVGIVAKIESALGLKSRDEILEADSEKLTGVMVSRGDLYLGLQGSPKIGIWARELMEAEIQIIRSAQEHATFSIVGTGMLGNLARKSVPLRSEPDDIAQAIEWGCSGCLLLTETASGPDPFRAVRLMDEIIKRSEGSRSRRRGSP